jgi:O-antigen/teichoic acid export membrane protein
VGLVSTAQSTNGESQASPSTAGAARPARKPSFLKESFIYGIGGVLTQAAGFVLVPVYTRCFTPDEYGTLEILSRIADVLIVCLLINGIRQAIFAFYLQSEDRDHQRRAMGTATILTAALAVIGGLALALAAEPMCGLLHVGSTTLFRLVALGLVIDTICLTPLSAMRARHESTMFVVATFGQFLTRVGLAILLVAGLRWGINGALLASILTGSAFALLLVSREVLKEGIHLDGKLFYQMVMFALPFLPGGLAAFVMNSGDRFFLLRYAGGADVGVYALGYKLGWTLPLFAVYPFWMVWCVGLYEAARRPDASTFFGRVLTRFLMAQTLCCLAICLFQDEIVRILGHGRYDGAAKVIPVIALASLFYQAALLLDAGFYIRHRTVWKIPITFMAMLIALAFYYLLIPIYGATGAAFAILAGFFSFACLTFLFVKRIFPVHYEYGRLAAMLGTAALLWLISRGLPPSLWSVCVKIALWGSWPAIMWAAGILTHDDKDKLRSLAWRTVSFLPRFSHAGSSGAPLVASETADATS